MSDEIYVLRRSVLNTGMNYIESARRGRQKALRSISKYCVRVTKDGSEVRKYWSKQPPALTDLMEKVGEDCILMSITQETKSKRPAPLQLITS